MGLGKSSSEESSEPPRRKTRGRPRKLPDGSITNEEKRARGRKIQHDFQQRRQAEVSQLQQMVAALESTIEGMSNEFLNFGDRIMQVATTPVVLNDIRQTTKRFLELAGKVCDPKDGLIVPSELSSSQTTSATAIITKSTWPLPPPAPAPFEFNSLFATAIPNLNIPTTGSTYLSQQHTVDSLVPTTGSGQLSPRLDYGLVHHVWSPSPSTPWNNPWLSYLIGGPNSFASRLYIDSLDLVVRATRGEVAVPGFIPSVLRYRFRHENPDSLMRSIATQLQRMSLGGHRGAETGDRDPEILVPGALSPNSTDAVFAAGLIIQSPAGVQTLPELRDNGSLLMYNPLDFVKLNEALENLLVKIGKDIMLEGGTPGDWLDPWSVQQYMNEEWGLRLNAGTVRPTPKTLRVLRSYQVVEQEMDVGIRSVQPITDVQQNLQWPSLDFGENFSPILPLISPSYTIPSFPFNSDPLVAQRLAFVEGVAPPATSSYIPTTIPTFQPVPVSGSAGLRSGRFHPKPSQSSGSFTPLLQAYQTEPSSSQNFTYAGSGSSSSNPKTPRTGTRMSPSSRSPSSTAPDNLISLPEILPATPLVTALILQSICFGEGPRYQIPIVNETVRNFLGAHLMTRG